MSDDGWKRMPLSEAVAINPPVRLERGELYLFVDMAAIESSYPLVRSSEWRAFPGGGSRFEDGDTLFARITPCLENGKIARFRADEPGSAAHGSTEFIVIRGRESLTTHDFAYYLARSNLVRNFAIGKMTGSSGRQRVPTNAFDHLTVDVPPLVEQRAIAAVLGALDDKIEHNRRTARALERLARAIFRAWFVDFEPVKAKAAGATSFPSMPQPVFDALPTRLVDSEIGPVPKGWVVGTFGSILTESTERNTDEHVDLVLSAVSSGELVASDDHFNKRVYSKSTRNYKVVPPGGIAFNPSRINIGSVGVNHRDSDGVVSPVYVVCDAPREFEWFFEFYLRLPKCRKQFEKLASGSVRQSLRALDFLSIVLAIPTRELVIAFNNEFLNIKELSDKLGAESRKLAELRDYLLPKLLSGQVRVIAAQPIPETEA